MATVILVRHGRSSANTAGVLAGRTAGVELDTTGREQAERAGRRIGVVPLAALVTSPLERCRQTADAVAAGQASPPETVVDDAVSECDYGDWQGRKISELAKEPLWKVVQANPSAAVFPGGESMATMSRRAVEAVRRHDAAVTEQHGKDAVWALVSHGDLVKAILADALGMHLDLFQRINVDPASLSIVRYTLDRPYVLAQNTHDGDLSWLTRGTGGEGVTGGGSGPAGSSTS